MRDLPALDLRIDRLAGRAEEGSDLIGGKEKRSVASDGACVTCDLPRSWSRASRRYGEVLVLVLDRAHARVRRDDSGAPHARHAADALRPRVVVTEGAGARTTSRSRRTDARRLAP